MLLKLDIPPNTKESKPATIRYNYGRALIQRAVITIPRGHSYLAHLEILSQGRPVYMRGERYIEGDDSQVTLAERVILEGPPYDLVLSGWNEDDTYFHSFYVEVQ